MLNFIKTLFAELETHGAWSGKCYNFECLGKYVEQLIAYSKEYGFNVLAEEVEQFYDWAEAEYETIASDDRLCFMSPADTYHLKMFDEQFYSAFENAANKLLNTLGVDDLLIEAAV